MRRHLRTHAATLLVVLSAPLVSGCGKTSEAPGAPDPGQVEIALYVAIQDGDVQVQRSDDDAGRPPLYDLYDITCQDAAFQTWGCTVELSDGSAVVCTVEHVERLDTRSAVIGGQARCKY